jgi:putative transposase
METQPATTKYKNHRFPIEIISHAVWLYFRFCLSFRDVEELLFERGVVVTYEALRKWCRKFANTMPISSVAVVHDRGTSGTSMGCF